MGKLTATAVTKAKFKERPVKLTDGGGLYLLLSKTGGKHWRYDYRHSGRRKTLSLGSFPEITLASARQRHQEARTLLAEGTDPSEAKRLKQLESTIITQNTFKAVATEWYKSKMTGMSQTHRERTTRILDKNLFPAIGERPIKNINAPELLACLRKIESKGTIDTAHRAKNVAGQVFRFGIACGKCERDPSQDLKGALTNKTTKHLPTLLDSERIKELLIAINNYQGSANVIAALKISILLFQRPGEIRHMEWSEINWTDKRWEIPANKGGENKKINTDHFVPLCKQALDILTEHHKLTGNGKYVFPSPRGASRPLSENGVRTALRTMGFTNDDITPHGFRAMARTLLDEKLGYRVDIIEAQLAHAVKDPTGRAYNRTSFLKERTEMMQAWADYLNSLKEHAR
ncbi:tyrosine-type recombinase/integrase [Alteromonas facilis]|uniref:tyrosine-type recombinase/integrase n=1 Tax=Alteromonas facilis TaxID=2048004 RepID=UPI000C28762B|nr:integrase arm-type DNA-binding domain-containing protein [Alteromonas facilis]